MTQDYLRVCKLTMGDGKGNQIDLSELRIRFAVEMADGGRPNTANITVTNLSDETMMKIQKEFDTVTLEAGYQSNYGLLFKGEVVQKRTGMESPVDTYLNIIARDSDRSYNHAVVSKSLAAGHTYKDQVMAALEPMKTFGVQVGFIADLGAKKMPSPRVLFGMSRDVLNTVATSTGTSWSIQNGQFQMVKNDATTGTGITLNSRTGLIGRPSQTIDGIEGQALITPQIRIGTRVQINQKDIQSAVFSPYFEDQAANNMIPPLNVDGFYKVVYIEFVGDTRGDDWYANFIAVTADPNGFISPTVAARGIQLPN